MQALELARRLAEPHLEAKALAALGTANVSLALIDEGMDRLDEAMAMVLSGEASSPVRPDRRHVRPADGMQPRG